MKKSILYLICTFLLFSLTATSCPDDDVPFCKLVVKNISSETIWYYWCCVEENETESVTPELIFETIGDRNKLFSIKAGDDVTITTKMKHCDKIFTLVVFNQSTLDKYTDKMLSEGNIYDDKIVFPTYQLNMISIVMYNGECFE